MADKTADKSWDITKAGFYKGLVRESKQITKNAGRLWRWIGDHPLATILSIVVLTGLAWILIETVRQGNLGFADKSLWEWLELFVVSAVIAFGLYLLRQREDKRDEARQEQEKARKLDKEHQDALSKYFDEMSELMLAKNLGVQEAGEEDSSNSSPADSNPNSRESLTAIAKARTLAVLRSLESDPIRVAAVFRFISEAHLEQINLLAGADLQGVDWSDANLSRANLSEASLQRAMLAGAYLNKAKLNRTRLSKANLSKADLSSADLLSAVLTGADLNGAVMRNAIVVGTHLRGADLSEAVLQRADLSTAKLFKASLSRAQLQRADLSEA
ncbi:MAG: pentapeptide repeat-containing protein, partial [Chloroflexota bacterium]